MLNPIYSRPIAPAPPATAITHTDGAAFDAALDGSLSSTDEVNEPRAPESGADDGEPAVGELPFFFFTIASPLVNEPDAQAEPETGDEQAAGAPADAAQEALHGSHAALLKGTAPNLATGSEPATVSDQPSAVDQQARTAGDAATKAAGTGSSRVPPGSSGSSRFDLAAELERLIGAREAQQTDRVSAGANQEAAADTSSSGAGHAAADAGSQNADSGGPRGGHVLVSPFLTSLSGPVSAVRVDAPSPVAPAELPQMAENLDAMIRGIRLQASVGGGAAVISLNPEYLGGMTITVKVDDGAVAATLQAASAEVRNWLEENESMLRDGLQEQGLSLEKLTVAEPSATEQQRDADESQRQHQEQAPPRHRRQARYSGERFEILA